MTHPEDMTEAELAEYYYAHRDELDGEEVEAEVVKPVSVTFAFRLPQEEAEAIRAAAEQAGITVSEFIRQSCRWYINAPRTTALLSAVTTSDVVTPPLPPVFESHFRSLARANQVITEQLHLVAEEFGEPYRHMIESEAS